METDKSKKFGHNQYFENTINKFIELEKQNKIQENNSTISTTQTFSDEDFELPTYNGKYSELISVHLKQIDRRQKRINSNKLGRQRNWLLWYVSPIDHSKSESTYGWLRSQILQIIGEIPRGSYKGIFEWILETHSDDFIEENGGLFVFKTDSLHQLFLLENTGIIGIYCPSASLKRSMEKCGQIVKWNWSKVGHFHSFFDQSQDLTKQHCMDESILEDSLFVRFGNGKDATLAVIDSGICPESKEMEERIIATWAVSFDDWGLPRPSYGLNFDEIGHSNQTASIAAGANVGIAKESNIISVKLPIEIQPDGKYVYQNADLAFAFELLSSQFCPLINGRRPLDIIDTILIPSGFYDGRIEDEYVFNKRIDAEAENIKRVISILHNYHNNIVVVAAVGNEPDKATFPSNHALAFSVGCLNTTGNLWEHCGSGFDTNGTPIPLVYVKGVNVKCEGLGNESVLASGTSMSAAKVAGLFTIMASKIKSSADRWRLAKQMIQYNEYNGNLPMLDI